MLEENNQQRPLYIPHAGPVLLEIPLLNKGSAFTSEERSSFNLKGLLPQNIESIEEQVERAYRHALCRAGRRYLHTAGRTGIRSILYHHILWLRSFVFSASLRIRRDMHPGDDRGTGFSNNIS